MAFIRLAKDTNVSLVKSLIIDDPFRAEWEYVTCAQAVVSFLAFLCSFEFFAGELSHLLLQPVAIGGGADLVHVVFAILFAYPQAVSVHIDSLDILQRDLKYFSRKRVSTSMADTRALAEIQRLQAEITGHFEAIEEELKICEEAEKTIFGLIQHNIELKFNISLLMFQSRNFICKELELSSELYKMSQFK